MVEHGNMTRAAHALRIVQPALTRSIKMLESDLRVTLFERTPKGVAPTIYGLQLVRYARAILNDMKRAEEELDATKGMLSGHVTFGTTLNYAYDIVPNAVLALRKKWPNLRVTVHEGFMSELADGVRSAELDFAFGMLAPPHAGIDASGLMQETVLAHRTSIIARADHPLVKQRKVSLSQLAQNDWAILGPEQAMGPYFNETFISRGLTPPRQVIVARSIHMLKKFLLGSDLISILASHAISPEIARGELAVVPCTEGTVTSETGFLNLERTFEAPAVKAMKQILRDQCRLVFHGQEMPPLAATAGPVARPRRNRAARG